MERNEPTTGEIIHELTALLPPMTNYAESICAEGAFAHSTYMVWDEPEPYIIKRAIDRIEQQEQRITELEREIAAAKAYTQKEGATTNEADKLRRAGLGDRQGR